MLDAALVVAAAVLIVGAGELHADIVSITSSADNTLYEDAEGDVSNGAGTGMFAGTTNMGFRRRALLRFDIAAALPSDAVVTSATLTLNISQGALVEQPFALHRMLADWGEGGSIGTGNGGNGAAAEPGDATWLHSFYSDTLWTDGDGNAIEGGFFDPAASASISITNLGPATWNSTPAMIADVQHWVDNPGESFGWLILGDETQFGTTKRFDTHEAGAAVRPILTIEYTAVPSPGGLALALPAWLLGGRRRRIG